MILTFKVIKIWSEWGFEQTKYVVRFPGFAVRGGRIPLTIIVLKLQIPIIKSRHVNVVRLICLCIIADIYIKL